MLLDENQNRILNHALFIFSGVAGISLICIGLGVRSQYVDATVSIALFISCVYISSRMIFNGFSGAAASYYILGCGIFYGVGPVISQVMAADMSLVSFGLDAQRQYLPKINALNATSLLISVSFIYLIVQIPPIWIRDYNYDRDFFEILEDNFFIILLIGFFSNIIWMYYFPRPDNFVLTSILRVLVPLSYFSILIGAIIWARLESWNKIIYFILFSMLIFYGLVSLSKTLALLPIASFLLGRALIGSVGIGFILTIILTAVFYWFVLGQSVGLGRIHPNYDPNLNSIFDRLVIISDSADLLVDMSGGSGRQYLATRFSMTPFQAYFMQQYDYGFPGNSFDALRWVLVPRVLWPNKPIFAPGGEFDLIFRGQETESSLAIGYITEGYYNQGWLGAVFVSVVAGIMIGIFTRKWLLFLRYPNRNAGIFFFLPVIMFQSLWVEGNFVGNIFSGSIRTLMIVLLVDVIWSIYHERKNKI